MSQIDASENVLSEDTAGQSNSEGDNLRLVPVAESIRYRKRAQSAEKKIETLTEQLAETKTQAAKIAEQLSDIQLEQKLTRKLVAAGTVDVETAVLIAKARLGGSDDTDLDGVIEQLRKEKRYPFGSTNSGGTVTAKRTAGIKDRLADNQTVLEKAAKRAAVTGNRTDLQEYLKLRRNFV